MPFAIENKLVTAIVSSAALTLGAVQDAATGKTAKQTIVHLPNLGMCFEAK